MGIVVGLVFGFAVGFGSLWQFMSTQDPIIQPEATFIATATPEPSSSPQESPLVSPSGSPTATPFITPVPTKSPTLKPTVTSTPTPTATPVSSVTPSPTPQVLSAQTVPEPTPDVWSPANLEPWFTQYANVYGVDKNVLERIANCESHFNASVVNGSYVGMFQFNPSTWTTYRVQMGLDTNLSLRTNAEESIKTAAYLVSKRGTTPWPSCI